MNSIQRIRQYFSSHDRAWVLSVIVLTAVLYLPYWASPLIFDDLTFFIGGIAAKYGHSLFSFELRWLPYATLGWTEWAFSNVVTHMFHLGNMVLHIANAILLFYLIRLILRNTGLAFEENRVQRLSWLAAMVFALHPVAVYAAGYIIQRSILMALMFSLALQLVYLKGLLSGNRRWLIVTVLLYFLAVFAKEHAVLMLPILLMLTFCLQGRIRVAKQDLWLTWFALSVIAILVSLIAKGVVGTAYEPMAAAMFGQQGLVERSAELHMLSVLTQAGLFFKYLLLWLIPNPAWMSIDMRVPFTASLGDGLAWAGFVTFLVYGAAAFYLLLQPGRKRWAGFALLYSWVQFLLEFVGIRIQEPFVLYRSYLWLPGLLLLIPILLPETNSRRFWAGAIVIIGALMAISVNRLDTLSSSYKLWDDAARKLQDEKIAGADRIFFNRGQALAANGKINAAIEDYRRALIISPQHAPVHFELGWSYGLTKRYSEAMKEFETTISLDPKFGNAYYGKAMLLKMQGDIRGAGQNMEKACELKVAVACLLSRGFVSH